MKKATLERVLKAHEGDDYHFCGGRDYHEPTEIMDCVREAIEYTQDEEITNDDDIRERINEAADSSTPIYNADLAKWFSENWSAFEEIAAEYGGDTMTKDVMRGIAMAYCATLEREAFAAFEEVWNEAEALEESEKPAEVAITTTEKRPTACETCGGVVHSTFKKENGTTALVSEECENKCEVV